MSEKHETISSENLFYCFVLLRAPDEMPRFFIVPSALVARYVHQQHKKYLKGKHRKPIKDTDMRIFRIRFNEAADGLKAIDFEDRWNLFD